MSEHGIHLRHPDKIFIGGEWVQPAGGSRFTVLSPHTETPYISVAEAEADDIDRAVAAARAAFDTGPWSRTTHAERAAYLGQIAAKLMERTQDLASAWTNQMGIVASAAQFGAPSAAGTFAAYAELAATYPFEERMDPSYGGGSALLVREPVGVVAAIVPWNAPMTLMANKVAPALLAGCTVIVKVSPEAPIEGYILAEICEEIGLPAGVLAVLTADREVSERLVRHPGVDKVSFTGSTAAGRRIASLCGERIARCSLELGGKSAAVILDDYPLETVAQSLTQSLMLMSGQVCASLTRVIVSKDRHDALIEALAEAFSAITVGDPYDPSTMLGPLAMERQRDRVLGYIRQGSDQGARLVCGGGRPAGLDKGWFVEPTLFANVDNGSTIAQEEIFGPVLSVIPAQGEEDAVRIANDTIYGLNNAVFTTDIDAAYRVGRRLRSGTVGQNAFRTDFGIAFGGFKQSGLGREGGKEGLLPYLETKLLLLDGDPAHVAA